MWKRFGSWPQKGRIRLLFEWFVILLLIIVSGILAKQYGAFNAFEYVAYDKLAWQRAQEADKRIVIIEIDDASLLELGRWPWSRKVHAQLLEKLGATSNLGILMDVLFIEPSERREDDRALVASVQALPNLVLPALLTASDGQILDLNHPEDNINLTPPIDGLRTFAHTGLATTTPDSDNTVRRMYMGYNVNGHYLQNVSALLLKSSSQQDDLTLISYTGGMNHYERYSYVDVLNGRIPMTTFDNRYVLIGSTATSLGDAYSTPLGLMSGVEIHANVLDGLLNHRSLKALDQKSSMAYVLLPLLMLMLGFLFISERWYFYWLLALEALWLGVCFYLLVVHQLWAAPITPCLLMVVGYVLWSWRRLADIMRYFDEQLQKYRMQTQAAGMQKKQEFTQVWTLQSMMRQIEKLEEEQQLMRSFNRDLIDYLSHDLRSPQVSILSAIAMYKKNTKIVPDAQLLTLLDTQIQGNVQKTLAYSRNLVELNHAQSGEFMLEMHQLEHILDYAVDQIYSQAKQKNIQIQVLRDPKQESWTLVDGELIERVLVNLLSNAVRYSPEFSPIDIRITQERIVDVCWAHIFISDKGQGMSEAQQQLLLKGKLKPSIHSSAKGEQKQPDAAGSMGIGWKMVRSIIDRHHGRLHIVSAPNQGSTIIVSLRIES